MTEVVNVIPSQLREILNGIRLDTNDTFNYRNLVGSRPNGVSPMIITTDFRVSTSTGSNSQPSKTTRDHLVFWSSPKNTVWEFNQRGTIQQTRAGHIAHFWRDDKRSTFFDNPSITFTFQTGNIQPLSIESRLLNILPPGLLDYYEFFSLLDEQKILSDGRPNYVNIVYNSLLYPNILLRGFFDPQFMISVQEDSTKPAQVTWSAKFILKESTPSFNDATKLQAAWGSSFRPIDTLVTDVIDDNDFFGSGGLNRDMEEFLAEKRAAEAAEAAERANKRKFIDFVPARNYTGIVGEQVEKIDKFDF